jgi:hypothetical protein
MKYLLPILLLLSPVFSSAFESYFTENKGQLEERVNYYYQTQSQNILIFNNGFAYDNYITDSNLNSFHHRVEIQFEGINKDRKLISKMPSDVRQNFYGPGKDIRNVFAYEKLIVENIYEGVDLVFGFSDDGKFKYDIIIRPEGNLNEVCFKVLGANAFIGASGLLIKLDMGDLLEEIPMSFIKETGQIVQVNYKQLKSNEFGFKSENNVKNQTLIIDPQPNLVWATYYGGSQLDEPYHSVGHKDGFLYVSGRTLSTTNISTSGAFKTTLTGNYDAFLAKFNTSGSLIWATYYGGSNYETFANIGLNKANEIICAGNTETSTGLATTGAYKTSGSGNLEGIFVKFDASGSRIWATYFGGSSIDEFYKLTIDGNQNIYFGGKSSSTGLATSGAYKTANSGGEDALVVSFTNQGSLRWCSYLGGTSQEWIGGIEYDGGQNIYMAGLTASSSGVAYNAVFQGTFGGAQDIYYCKFDTSGVFRWVNYLGSTGTDYLQYLKFDSHSKLYLAGHTTSSSSMTTSGVYQTSYGGSTDGYLFSFDSSGRRNWSTYVGGSGFDEIRSIQSFNDFLFVAGRTESTNSISTANAHQANRSGGQDNFLMRFDVNGNKDWGTYYGSSADDRPAELTWLNGALYLTGYTASSTGIATTGSHQSSYGGGGDAFIAKFDNLGCGANMYGKMVRPTLCAGDSNGIAAVFVANNTGNPTFKWKTTPPQFNDTAFGLPSGFHEVVVSDTFGCIDSLKVIVLEPTRLSAFVRDSLPVSCAGFKNGRLIADAVGGNYPYFFQWQTTPKISKDTLSGLSVGTYKVRVTDIHNCVDSAVGRITEPDTLKSSISGYNHATCFLLNNGQISASATGGTQPYSYLWSSSPPQTTSTAYNLRAGYYEVQITDKNGCQSKSSYTITEPSPITIGLTGLNYSICYNDSLGEIFTKIWGGTPGYKIQWNSNPLLNTSNLTKLRGGTYRITVIDDNNCSESKDFIISEPKPLSIQFDTVIQPLCYGSSEGSIFAKVGGGTLPHQLFWNASPFNNVPKISNLNAGLYTLMVKDSVGCTLADSIRLIPKDSILITGQIVHPKCFGGNDGKVLSAAFGGTAPYKFLWSHNPSLNNPLLNNIPAGNYYLTVTDNNACIQQAQFIVLQPNPLEVKKTLQNDVKCHSGNDGALSVFVNGGTAPLQIKWDNPPSQSAAINNLKAGVYTVLVTDSQGCADSMIFQINEPPLLIGYFDSIYSPSCYAQPNGTVTYKANGGVQPYTYAFDNAPFQLDSLARFVKAGWIRVKVLDAHGCQINDSAFIKQPESLRLESEINQVTCFSLQNGKIILKGFGGVQPYNFKWSHTAQDTHTAYQLNQGSYVVSMIDKNNCTLRDTFQIFQPEKLVAKVDLTIPASCFNVANGIAGGSASGGIPAYDFYWKGPSNYTGNNPIGMKSGAYMMIVKDKNGCMDSSATFIGQPNKVASSVIATQSPRCVDSTDGWAEVAALPGVGPYSYRWSNGSRTARAENLAKGNYSVVITDKCGDTAMAYITISDPAPFIIPNISGFRASFRGNQEVYQIAEVSGWSYFWEVTNGTITSGQGTAKITVLWNGPGQGNVMVKVVNGSGCIDDNFYQVSLTDECMYVFPNPTNLKAQVVLPSAASGEWLQIFDARGRKVLEEPASVQNNIDVSYYARGIYFIRYRDCVIKFLKE